MKKLFVSLMFILVATACAPKMHEGKYTHEEYWGTEIHRGHAMDYMRHDAGHDFECGANGILLDHCNDDQHDQTDQTEDHQHH